jgi:hypothetical protein
MMSITYGNPEHKPPPPATSTAPVAFRIPCPGCGTDVLFPYDPVLSARLDQLLVCEEQRQQPLGPDEELTP